MATGRDAGRRRFSVLPCQAEASGVENASYIDHAHTLLVKFRHYLSAAYRYRHKKIKLVSGRMSQ